MVWNCLEWFLMSETLLAWSEWFGVVWNVWNPHSFGRIGLKWFGMIWNGLE